MDPKQKLSFQAEVAQLLHLVTHSLYSNKDIFLRELVSNASDACDKLRFEALADPKLYEDAPNLEVRVEFDKAARTLTITDNGIGLSRQEAVDNLGTIAKSGTREFMSRLSGDQKADAQLIGQFGVGFYSGFIVADRITVESRRAGLPPADGVRWASTGAGDFEVESITREARGTSVVLHLREDAADYLSSWKLKSIIARYSDHISLPILMRKEEWKEGADGQPGEHVLSDEWETVNQASALWTRAKKDITEEQYKEFYKAITHDGADPLAWSHNRVEGATDYTQLLYVPSKAPFDLWNRDKPHGVKLYVKRVFIMDDAQALLPLYLRFVKGVVDSADLPLNVSRELLQESRDVKAIREGNTRRVLSMLEDLAKGDGYGQFWSEFGSVLKEGLGEDFGNTERIAKLLRFASTTTDAPTVSFADYKARMKEGQEAIYYITGETLAAAKNSPQLEVFRKKGIEVLLMADRVDEWALGFLNEFDGTPLLDQLLKAMRQEHAVEAAANVDLHAQARESIGALIALADQRNIDLGVSEASAKAPAPLKCSPGDLRSVIDNLIENALRYTPEGGVVDVKLLSESGRPALEVMDTGPGIPQELLPRVFDRFFRVPGTSAPGSGLGLAIAQSAADRCGLKLTLRNRSDRSGLVARVEPAR